MNAQTAREELHRAAEAARAQLAQSTIGSAPDAGVFARQTRGAQTYEVVAAKTNRVLVYNLSEAQAKAQVARENAKARERAKRVDADESCARVEAAQVAIIQSFDPLPLVELPTVPTLDALFRAFSDAQRNADHAVAQAALANDAYRLLSKIDVRGDEGREKVSDARLALWPVSADLDDAARAATKRLDDARLALKIRCEQGN